MARLRRGLYGCRSVLLLLVIFCGSGVAAAQEMFRVGVDPTTPPFAYLDENNDMTGFDVEIARAVCDTMWADCKLVATPFDQLLEGVRDGSLDFAVSSVSITDERLKLVDFSEPYFNSPARFIGPAQGHPGISEEGLSDVVVGVKRGTTFERYLTGNYGESVRVVRYRMTAEALFDLVQGRVDLVLGDSVAMREGFLKSELGIGFRALGPRLDDPKWFGYGIGIPVRKGRHELLRSLNDALAEIRADETYQTIADRYFP